MIPVSHFTVGNTITVAIAIYKQNWKKYLTLSLIAHLWLLVPVYGWARYFAIAAWISKLSLNELGTDFDSLNYQQYFKISSLIKLFVIAIYSIFIPMMLSNMIMMPLAIISPIFFKILLQFPDTLDFIENNLFLLGYLALFIYYLIWIWIYTRLFITDLAYGNYLKNTKFYPYPIKTSYHLTKNNMFKIYKII